MNLHMDPEDWLEIVRKEYLQDFIRGGGAAVKFVVPKEDLDHGELNSRLREVSEAEGYLYALVDAAKTRVHMIDQIFHEIARQVAWEDLAFSFVSRIISERYKVPALRDEFNLRKIAELNERVEQLDLPNELTSLIEKNLYYDYQMCQEFRIAMIRLCQAQLDPERAPVPSGVIKAWLRGELRRIVEIKPGLIFQKVERHNARHMLSSLSHWSHLTGITGLAVTLDISRCLDQPPKPRDPQDDTRYYNVAMAMDAYEVLRQFVDATDELEFCFITVIAPPAFLHPPDERQKSCRSLWGYDALKLRIWDEVRDKHRANPLSSLMRLSLHPEDFVATHSREDMR